MKRSNVKFHHLLTILLAVALWTAEHSMSFAQTQERESQSVSVSTTPEGKVVLKVVKKIGNDETTFEKTYDSYEDIARDPDLEKYGIQLDGFSFGGSSQPKFFFHNGPGMDFWDNEEFEDDMSRFREKMKQFMDLDWGGNAFTFGLGKDEFMEMDSLIKRFNFRNDNGRFFFNGEEFKDMDSLRESIQGKFGRFMFDFDDDTNGAWIFGSGDDEEDIKVITRRNLAIRPATMEDKILAGVEKNAPLVLRDINFYPNPSDGRFDLSLESDNVEEVQISVLNATGEEVLNLTTSPKNGFCEFQVDLTKEDKGNYVLKIIQGKSALTKRLVLK